MSETMTATPSPKRLLVKDVLQKTTQFFREKGIDTARLDAELLIAAALNWERMKIYLNYEYPLSDAELALCRESVRRRAAGEPVAYILGKRDFYNHSFKVSPAVLIPRPETEQVVDETVGWLRAQAAPSRIVDLGTGSGCIGLSILAEVPDAQLAAIDISPEALEVARTNAEALGVGERAHFMEADAGKLSATQIEELVCGSVDAVVANPPYIAEDDPEVEANVKRFEPPQALFSTDQGLAHIKSWSAKAAELLRPGGWTMFEIGYQQGQAACEVFEASGQFRDIQVVKDLSGRERFIRAIRASE